MGFLTAVENTMKSMATGTKNSVEALAERGNKVAGAIDDHFARYANDPTPYSGYMADQAHALSAVAKHAVGGGLIGGSLNAVAYENGASWTGAESVGSAFMGGAGYGAAAGGLLGMTRFGIYSKANQMNRISAHNRSANSVGQTGFWSGLKGKADDFLVRMARNAPERPNFDTTRMNAHLGDPTLDMVNLRGTGFGRRPALTSPGETPIRVPTGGF